MTLCAGDVLVKEGTVDGEGNVLEVEHKFKVTSYIHLNDQNQKTIMAILEVVE